MRLRAAWHEFRLGLRGSIRRPAVWIAGVASVALGIGASTAIFTVLDAAVLRPLPFRDPERLVVVHETQRDGVEQASGGTFLDWRAEARGIESMAAWAHWGMALTGEGEPRQLHVIRVSAELFPTLGVAPARGRGFLTAEDTWGGPRVAMVSHGFWQRVLGGDPGIVGRTLTLDGEPHRVVGVMPATFRFPEDGDVTLWVPLALDSAERASRERRMFEVVARLRPGQTVEQARVELSAVSRRLAESLPALRGWEARVTPAREAAGGSGAPLALLVGAVAFVLLIAIANLISLLLARGIERRGELAVRRALGAPGTALAGAFLGESVGIAAIGAALGVVLAPWLTDLVLALDPGWIPRWNPVGLNLRVLGFAAAVTLLCAVVAGLVPAAQLAGERSAMVGSGRVETTGRASRRTHRWLIVAQVALAFVLLAGAGLLTHSLLRLRAVDPGFRTDRLLVTSVNLTERRYPDDAQQLAFFDRMLERVASLPGVGDAALVTALPFDVIGIDHDIPMLVEGQPVPEQGREPQADFRSASPGYFATLGIPVLRGRGLDAGDVRGAPAVAVVNQEAVRVFFGGADPIGQTVRLGRGGGPKTIVGVIADIRHRSLADAPRPEVYVPYTQWWSYGQMMLVLRAEGRPEALAAPLAKAVQALDPQQPIGAVSTMQELIATSVAPRAHQLTMLIAVALLGLVLAGVGIYGLVAYSVGRRTREIGVRVALGARPDDVFRRVVGEGLVLVVQGLVLGGAGAVLLTRSLRALLYEVSPADPAALAAPAAALLLVGALAAWRPARSAASVDPVQALRAE